jgi:tetratricopeptide (TPR) repeat protein
MPLKEQDQFLIEKYLLGQLSTSERSAFDNRLADPDFKKELDLQNDLMVAFQAEGRTELKRELQSLESKIQRTSNSQEPKPKTARLFTIGRILAIAATVSLLIVIGFWMTNRSVSGEQLFAENYVPYPNVVAPISKSDAEVSLRDQAFQAYERKAYQDALDQFERLNTEDDAVKLYSGLSRLALDNLDSAISSFDLIIDQESPYFAAAQWYKALALIKSGKKEEAKAALELVTATTKTDVLQEQAEKLLSALE